MTRIAIASPALSAEIDPLGAELQSLRDADGRELMWSGDAAWWTGRAPVLFPIVGGLPDDRYVLDGTEYRLPKHGFARRSTFEPVAQAADGVTFRLTDSAETRAAWPFAFRFDLRFAIADAVLTMTATVANTGDRAMPVSFGFHPAFAWPLPYGAAKADHGLRFDRPEPADIRRVDTAGLLTPASQPTPVDGRDLALRSDLFEDDALIFDALESRGLVYGAAGRPGLRMAWRNLPDLGVWQKPGADYVCVEPWAGFAAPIGFAEDLRRKPGIVDIAVGGERVFEMSVAVEADPLGA